MHWRNDQLKWGSIIVARINGLVFFKMLGVWAVLWISLRTKLVVCFFWQWATASSNKKCWNWGSNFCILCWRRCLRRQQSCVTNWQTISRDCWCCRKCSYKVSNGHVSFLYNCILHASFSRKQITSFFFLILVNRYIADPFTAAPLTFSMLEVCHNANFSWI